jgi:integrase
MKLVERERVDGTQVTIGKRVHCRKGERAVSRRYAAEYVDANGKQTGESLGTSNRAQARRKAIEIQQRLDVGGERIVESRINVEELVDRYFDSVKAKDVAPKTVWKYRADLDKLVSFCADSRIERATSFGEDELFRFRSRLIDQNYAPKTVLGAVMLAKQVFKWAWRQGLLRNYSLAAASVPKAKPRPQPCFTTAQVDQLIEIAAGEEKTAFALMAFAGLRIGEVEQLEWSDLCDRGGSLRMIHVRRGGSRGMTKDKEDRFVPVHPRIEELLGPPRAAGRILSTINERRLLGRLKKLCVQCRWPNAYTFKLHSFRHHFASMCANNHVAHRKALAWLGHSSSDMLDLYYHLHDDDSQQAMLALANGEQVVSHTTGGNDALKKGNSRAIGESTNEKTPQTPDIAELVACLNSQPERGGFEPPVRLPVHTLSKRAPSATRSPLLPRFRLPT